MTAHYVYRCYGADGVLLYVGASKNVTSRLAQHRVSAFWSARVVKVKAKAYPDKEVAHEVERRAIASESPKYNVYGKQGGRASWSDEDFVAHLDMVISTRPARSSSVSRSRLGILFDEYADRFDSRHHLEVEIVAQLDKADAEMRAQWELDRVKDAERSRVFREREAAENRAHLAQCCSCRHGIGVDEDLVKSHGHEFDPIATFPSTVEQVPA